MKEKMIKFKNIKSNNKEEDKKEINIYKILFLMTISSILFGIIIYFSIIRQEITFTLMNPQIVKIARSRYQEKINIVNDSFMEVKEEKESTKSASKESLKE